MQGWLLYSLIALLGWGVWGYVSKLASSQITPYGAAIYGTLGSLIAVFFLLLFRGFPSLPSVKGMVYVGLSGFIATLMFIPFMVALSRGKASVVVTITALYPLITILLSVFFLHETITIRQGFGIALALLSVILIQM